MFCSAFLVPIKINFSLFAAMPGNICGCSESTHTCSAREVETETVIHVVLKFKGLTSPSDESGLTRTPWVFRKAVLMDLDRVSRTQQRLDDWEKKTRDK